MAKDISRKSVMILVSVALIVSILSTLFVLYSVGNYNPRVSVAQEEVIVSTGTVTFNVPSRPPAGRATLEVPAQIEEEIK